MIKKFSVLLLLSFMLLSSVASAKPILIRAGSRGDDVRAMQERLIALEYMEGEPDGICGSIMVRAIRRFQRDRGLAADGILGPMTYDELMRQDGKKASEVTPSGDPAQRGEPVWVDAVAYSPEGAGMGKYTALGLECKRGVIAVDPSFIPLGTKVYIPGYGEAIAADTGTSIKGNIIDIAFDTYEESAAFGRQQMEIYILEYPS